TLEELVQKFSIDRVHSAGAKFDYEKAKWFNQEWIKRKSDAELAPLVKQLLATVAIAPTDETLVRVIGLVKERCQLLPDFVQQSSFFFEAPKQLDLDAVKPKWNDAKRLFFAELIRNFQLTQTWVGADLERNCKEIAAANNIKPGEVMLPLRIMLVGGKFGPGVFDIVEIIGKEETISRIEKALHLL